MKNKVIIITGSQGSGKTTYLKEIIKILEDKQCKISGIVADGYWKNKQRERFELVDQNTGKQIIFCQRDEVLGWEKIRNFFINPAGQQFGEEALKVDLIKNSDICVIDEMGPFELAGKGWSNAINEILGNTRVSMIWVVRKSLLKEILAKWNITPLLIIESEETQPTITIERIYNLLVKNPD